MAAAPPAISAYWWLSGYPTAYQWLLIDGTLSLTFDGVSPHLSVVPLTFGAGFLTSISPGQPQQVNLDTSYIGFRVPVPTGPGPAVNPVTGLPYGTGAWAADSTGMYVLVPDPDNPGLFIWARALLSTTW